MRVTTRNGNQYHVISVYKYPIYVSRMTNKHHIVSFFYFNLANTNILLALRKVFVTVENVSTTNIGILILNCNYATKVSQKKTRCILFH